MASLVAYMLSRMYFWRCELYSIWQKFLYHLLYFKHAYSVVNSVRLRWYQWPCISVVILFAITSFQRSLWGQFHAWGKCYSLVKLYYSSSPLPNMLFHNMISHNMMILVVPKKISITWFHAHLSYKNSLITWLYHAMEFFMIYLHNMIFFLPQKSY